MNNIPDFVRPGGRAYVSPENLVYGTDGKLRWAYEFDQRKKPTVLLAALGKYVTLCAAVGVLILLVQAGKGGAEAMLSAVPVVLTLIAAGAVVAVLSFGVYLLQNGPRLCLLFTMDEDAISCQRVKGKTDQEAVTHAFAVWVGGQSQPALQVCDFRVARFNRVSAIVADPIRHRIRLRGGKGLGTVFARPQQFSTVLDYLNRHCPQIG